MDGSTAGCPRFYCRGVSAGSNAGHTRHAGVYLVNEVWTYCPTARGGAAGLFLLRGEPAVLPPGTPVMQVWLVNEVRTMRGNTGCDARGCE